MLLNVFRSLSRKNYENIHITNIAIRSAVTGRHSKNVAGKKNKLDALKQKLYNRLAVKIFMAAKCGLDPSTNKELSRALKEAKDNKLPV